MLVSSRAGNYIVTVASEGHDTDNQFQENARTGSGVLTESLPPSTPFPIPAIDIRTCKPVILRMHKPRVQSHPADYILYSGV
jgi:hypothetical protein